MKQGAHASADEEKRWAWFLRRGPAHDGVKHVGRSRGERWNIIAWMLARDEASETARAGNTDKATPKRSCIVLVWAQVWEPI
jgi:hypothetical protein